MATLHGYDFPDALWYHARYMVWLREEPSGEVALGLSALALATAGEILVFAARPLGASVEPGRAIGNVETAKTVSSVQTPIAGRIVAANAAVEANGELIARDPYAAWLVRLAPADWVRDRATLLQGAAALAAIEAEMALYRFDDPRPPL
jgi:glycine cleavage system H protein